MIRPRSGESRRSRSPVSRPGKHHAARRLQVEPLEARWLLAAAPDNMDWQLRELLAAQAVEPVVGPALPGDSAVAGAGEVLRVTPGLAGADLVDLRISTRVDPAELISPLAQLGLKLGSYSQPYHLIEGQLPVSSLAAAAELPGVQSLTPLYRPWRRTGSVTSQGDAILKAVEARAAGYDGSGVTVGVLSDSVNRVGGGLAGSIAAGDLPGPGNPLGHTTAVGVLQDFRGDSWLFDVTDEGRAMLEIVHDLAPGAALMFHTAAHGELDFAEGIRELARAGAQVIIDDVAYLTEPFFQDGIIAQAIEEVVRQYGVTYVTAAGNDHGVFYDSLFRDDGDAAAESWQNFAAAGEADLRLRFTSPAGSRGGLLLQWSDPWYTSDGVTNDFDLYAFNPADGSVQGSANTRNMATQQPYELLIWGGSPQAAVSYDIGIKRVSGSGPAHLKLWAIYGTLDEYNGGAAIVGHAMAAGAISVGAVPFYDPNNPAAFSSRGPATVYYDAQGNRLAAAEVRYKPDVVATDNVNTSFFGADIPQDADTAPNFAGTSAAAPHVAAVAAQLLSARSTLTPSQRRAALQSQADDLGEPGWDGVFGAGRVNALSAVTEVVSNPAYDDTEGPTAVLRSPAATTARPIGFATLQFSEPLDATTATQAANYELRSSGADGVFHNADDAVFTLTPAYDAGRRQTRLTWTAPDTVLPVGQYRLSALAGLRDLAGNPLQDGTAQLFGFERTLWGEDFLVGGFGNSHVDVAVAPTGEAMVVWTGDDNDASVVLASIYDANGARVEGPFEPYVAYAVHAAAVAYDPTGHFVVAFADRWDVQGSDVYLAKYDLDGHEDWLVKFRDGWHFDGSPSVAVDALGNVYAAVSDAVWPGEDHLFLRKFGPDGQPLTAPIRADNEDVTAYKREVALAADRQGNVAVVWRQGLGVYDGGILARLFDAQLVPQTAALLVDNPAWPDHEEPPAVIRDEQGFVVAWAIHQSLEDRSDAYLRFYDNAGAPRTLRLPVGTPGVHGDTSNPSLAMDAQGGVIATFVGAGGLMARRFDASGVAQGREFQVPGDGSASAGQVASDEAGNFLVAWAGPGSPYARWFIHPLPALPDLRVESASVPQRLTPGVTEQITAAVRDVGVVPLPRSNVRYSLSADDVAGNGDDRLVVAPDEFYSWPFGGYRRALSVDFVVPADLTPGTYHIFIELDPYDLATELDEANNVQTLTVDVSAAPAALGELREVNTTTVADQKTPVVAMAADGRYLVVWSGNGPGDESGIFGQFYDAWGNPQGSEFRVNTTLAEVQQSPAIASDGSGGLIVVWESQSQDGSGWGIVGQRFSWSGTPAGGELVLNDITSNDQTSPAVGMDSGGNFVAAWLDSAGGGHVYYRRFAADGTPREAAQRLERDSSAVHSERSPALAVAPDGRWVAVWASAPLAWELRGQRFNADGTRHGEQLTVNSTGFGSVADPQVALDSGGRLLAAWTYGSGDIAARFAGWDEGNPAGSFRVNAYQPGAQAAPSLALAADGQAVIAWVSPEQGGQHLVGQRFDAQGQPLGGEFYLTEQLSGSAPAMAMNQAWHFAAAWQRSGDEAATLGVFDRVFGTPSPDLAELQAESVAGPAAAYLGGPLPVSSTVRNAGAAAAGSFSVQYALFADPVAQPLYVLGPLVPIEGGLAAGAVWTDANRILTVPASGIPAGTYYLGVIADPAAAVAEHVRRDNRLVSTAPLLIAAAAWPDLQVDAVSVAEASIGRGRDVTVSWTVTNRGLEATPAAAWYDQVVFSLDPVCGNADDVAALAPTFAQASVLAKDASYTATRTVSLPFALTDRVTVFVETDVTGVIGEPACEDNNFAAAATQLQILEPVPAAIPVVEGFEAGSVNALAPAWAFDRTSGTTAVTSSAPHTGAYALWMSDGTDRYASTAYYQAAVLHVDLASASDVTLDFWARHGGSWSTGTVLLSADGLNWTTLLDTRGRNAYDHYVFDLDALHLTYTSDVQILFRHISGWAGEMWWDDIRVATGIDVMGARVVTQVPAGATDGPLSGIQVVFDEDVDPQTFTAADVTVTGPGGGVVALNSTEPVVDSGAHRSFTIQLAAPQGLAGHYTVSVGPDILDVAGNPMNQNNDALQGDGYLGGIDIVAQPALPPLADSFEAGSLSDLGHYWSFSQTSGTTAVTSSAPHAGAHALWMSDGTDRYSSTAYYQAAVLHVDLASASDVTLDFWARHGGSWSTGAVFVSVDGVNWTTLLDTRGRNAYDHYVFDLDALNLTYTSDVQILFRHISGWAGEMWWDDIRVATGIDVMGARVVTQVPAGATDGPLSGIQVVFDEDVDGQTFTAADVTVTGPGGGVVALNSTAPVVDSGDHRTFTIQLTAPQGLAGHYTVSVGPDILDVAGNPMNQNNDALQGDGYLGGIDIVARPAVPPVSEGFEAGSLGGLGPYWSFSQTSGTTGVTSSAPHTGTYSLWMYDGTDRYSSTAYYQAAVLHVDLASASDVTLDFWARHGGSWSTGAVFVSVDGVNWTTLLDTRGRNAYDHYVFDLDALNLTYTSDVQILFRHISGWAGEMWWDDIRVATGIDVWGARVVSQSPAGATDGPLSSIQVVFDEDVDPQTFTAADVTVTGPGGGVVALNSTAPIVDSGDHRTFTIQLAAPQGLAGHFTVSVGPNILDVAGNEMNQNHDNLQGDAYVGGIDIVARPAVPPVSEGFEAGSLGGLGPYWSFSQTSGTTGVTSSAPHTGTYALWMYDGTARYSSTAYYQAAVLHVNLASLSDVTLDFWARHSGSWSTGAVFISVDGVNWRTLLDTRGRDAYDHYFFNLDALNLTYTSDVQILFRHISGWAGGMWWDDIRVRSKAPAVTGHSPPGEVGPSPASLRFDFDEPMNSGSFAVADDIVSFDGPSGSLRDQITGFSWIDSDTLEVQFNAQATPGRYQLTLGPNVLDLAGRPLDQDADGSEGEAGDDQYTGCFAVTDDYVLRFDGADDHVTVPSSASLGFPQGSSITLEAWVYPSALTGGNTIVAKNRTAGVENANYVMRAGNGSGTPKRLAFYYRSGTTWQVYQTSSDVLQTGVWQHVAVTYTFGSGGSLQTYVDGVLKAGSWVTGSGNVAPAIAADPLWIGAITTGGSSAQERWNGQIEDVRIWDYARTEEQIRAGLASPPTGDEPGLVGYWNFNDLPAGTQSVLDRTPNHNDGYLGASSSAGGDDPARLLDDHVPTVASWTLRDDSGADANDRLTNDRTPELTVCFSEPVRGEAQHVQVVDPQSNPVASMVVTGLGTGVCTLGIHFQEPLAVDGIYDLILQGTNGLRDTTGNWLNGGSGEVLQFSLDTVPPRVTVKALTTNDTTPMVTGTISDGTLQVEVNGKSYTAGDGNLNVSGANWTLLIPPGDALPRGTYNVAATATDTAGNVGSDSTTDELRVVKLIVTSLNATPSGFVAQFSGAFKLDGLNLYDGAGLALGPADVMLQDGANQVVAGSLTVADSRQTLEFVKTGGVLVDGAYTVTIKSGAAAFRALDDDPLDGNDDGTTGDDYTGHFTVAATAERIVSIPDMARGAGQSVNIPGAASGLPVRLSDAAGVTLLAVDLVYDEDLLEITAATLAAGLPGDWSVVNPPDTSTPGVARIRAFGTTPLSGTNVEVVRLTAAVPGSARYGAVQAIRLENVSLNGGAIAAIGDVAVHKAVYLGDADGSGIHSSADAFLTVQAALGLASGFAAHAWTDPRIVGDADGSGVLSAADAFLVVQEGLGQSEPFVPDNPHIGVTPVVGGVDPQFQIGVDLPASAGGLVTVPVKLAVEPAATNVGGFDFELFFDPERLTIQLPRGVSAGADTAGWAVSAVLVTPGQLRVGMVSSSGRPLAVGLREIARLQFRVEGGEAGRTGLDIEPVDARAGGYTWTDTDGSVLIRPADRALSAAARQRIWQDVDAKAGLLETVLADLIHEIAAARR